MIESDDLALLKRPQFPKRKARALEMHFQFDLRIFQKVGISLDVNW
jgi:hypothetical protein